MWQLLATANYDYALSSGDNTETLALWQCTLCVLMGTDCDLNGERNGEEAAWKASVAMALPTTSEHTEEM